METNMEHVREVAKALLFTDIHETKFSPMIVQHPFTSSGIVGLPTADGVELVNEYLQPMGITRLPKV